MTYILLIIGFALLIKGASWLVNGASSLAKRLGVSEMFIGLTIVAFGTSAPELSVNVISSLKGEAEIAIGNILGSNIANIFLIGGLSALIYPLSLQKNTIWKEIPFSLLAAVIIFLMANDTIFNNEANMIISRSESLILLAFFVIFFYSAFSICKIEMPEPLEKIEKQSIPRSIFFIIIGLTALIVGGKWIVNGAISIATALEVSETLIGLTIVAVGTSLPELATSALAAYKKKSDIAIGNIVGSNILNIFFVLGVSGIIAPLPFHLELNTDILMAILASFLLFLAAFSGRKKILDRFEGAGFIGIYIAYISYLIYRG